MATRDEQTMADACRRLIQNAIVLWNYLYLSEYILSLDSQEKIEKVLSIICQGSMMVWAHINLHGEYNFLSIDETKGSSFDVPKIMALQVA